MHMSYVYVNVNVYVFILICACMHGWMDGWMDGCMCARVHVIGLVIFRCMYSGFSCVYTCALSI